MVMKISFNKIKWIVTVIAPQTGDALVQFGFVVLEILEDALNGALLGLRSQGLKTDVL